MRPSERSSVVVVRRLPTLFAYNGILTFLVARTGQSSFQSVSSLYPLTNGQKRLETDRRWWRKPVS